MPLFHKATKVTLKIEGMSCAHCEMRVSKAAKEIQGVRDAKASHETGTVVLTLDRGLADLTAEMRESLAQAVREAGYQLTE